MEDRQAVCLTMRLCCSSASEDLGCRRGDFSRKHYGSVELVSPIHSALVSLCDCLLILFLLHLLIDSSPHDLPSLSASPCYYLPLFSVGMDGQQRGTDESWRTGCGPAMRFASVDHSGFSTHSDVGLCRLLTSFVLFWRCRCKAAAQCVSLWLIRKLLSHCCFRGGVCVCVCARVSPSSAELSLYILIAQRDRKSKGFALRSYFLPGTYCGFVHECCAPRVQLISVEEKPHAAYQGDQTDTMHKCCCVGVCMWEKREGAESKHCGECEPGWGHW